MCYAGVCPPKISYEREDPDAIGDHGKGVPQSDALLAMQEATLTVPCVSYHQGSPVEVAVEGELLDTRSLIPDSPNQ